MTQQNFIKNLITTHPGIDLEMLQKKSAGTINRLHVRMVVFKLLRAGEVKRKYADQGSLAKKHILARHPIYFVTGPWSSTIGADPFACAGAKNPASTLQPPVKAQAGKKRKPARLLSMKDFGLEQKYTPFLSEGKTAVELEEKEEEYYEL